MIYLDTHVVIWLYSGEVDRFSPRAVKLIETEDLKISPAVILETEYLYEAGKITVEASAIVEYLESALGLLVCEVGFHRVAVEALALRWTRAPFDRLIVAHAKATDCILVSRDTNIREHYHKAVW